MRIFCVLGGGGVPTYVQELSSDDLRRNTHTQPKESLRGAEGTVLAPVTNETAPGCEFLRPSVCALLAPRERFRCARNGPNALEMAGLRGRRFGSFA